MKHYRSVADLSYIIRKKLYKVPRNIDLVVGIPRSGTLAGSLIALSINRRYCDLPSFLASVEPMHGSTRKVGQCHSRQQGDKMHVLVVDDSLHSGKAMTAARQMIQASRPDVKATYCAVFAAPYSINKCDIFLESLDVDRAFEWNLMHREDVLSHACLDIDGILCRDPSSSQNDDGDMYKEFLASAPALMLPSYKIGYLVTSRLEKYREHTVAWLAKHQVIYGSLYMLDLPSAAERRRMNCHAQFKGQIYKSLTDSQLFVESEKAQALSIANIASKPVLCYETQELFAPSASIRLARSRISRAFKSRTQNLYAKTKEFLKYF